jgi:hypothetical protein
LLLCVQDNSARMIAMATCAKLLLLHCVRDDPAIMMVTHAKPKLHLIVAFIRRASTTQTTVDLISVSEGELHQAIHQGIQAKLCQTIQVKFRRVIQAKLCRVLQAQLHQVTPATICNDSFELIDTFLASEGAALCSEGAQPAPTISSNELCGRRLIVDFIPTTLNLLLPPALNGAIALTHQLNLHVESKS